MQINTWYGPPIEGYTVYCFISIKNCRRNFLFLDEKVQTFIWSLIITQNKRVTYLLAVHYNDSIFSILFFKLGYNILTSQIKENSDNSGGHFRQ